VIEQSPSDTTVVPEQLSVATANRPDTHDQRDAGVVGLMVEGALVEPTATGPK